MLGGTKENVICSFSNISHSNGISVNVFFGYSTRVAPNHKGVKISCTLASNEMLATDKQWSVQEKDFVKQSFRL